MIHIFLLNILNSFLMFDLSLQGLKGDTCRSHSSTLAVHSLAIVMQ